LSFLLWSFLLWRILIWSFLLWSFRCLCLFLVGLRSWLTLGLILVLIWLLLVALLIVLLGFFGLTLLVVLFLLGFLVGFGLRRLLWLLLILLGLLLLLRLVLWFVLYRILWRLFWLLGGGLHLGHLIEVAHELGHVIVLLGGKRSVAGCTALLTVHGVGIHPQLDDRLLAQLGQDVRQHFHHLSGLPVTSDGEGVGRQGSLRLGVVEVNHREVILDDVDLLDARDSAHRQLLEGALQLLVVGGRRLVHDLLLPPRSALPPDPNLGLQALQLLHIHLAIGIWMDGYLVSLQLYYIKWRATALVGQL